MKYLILAVTLIAAIFFIAEAQEQKEKSIPYSKKAYDLNCFTPKGWVKYKTSSFAPYSKAGIWRVHREDGSFFSSSMCQIEKM